MAGRDEIAAWRARLAETTRRVCRELVERFARNDILTFASAISFQVLVALIPLFLLALTLAGYVGLGSVWEARFEPFVQEHFPYATFVAVSTTVQTVIEQHRLLWLSAALALTIWEWSGSVRAVMGALNRIFEAEEHRPIWRRFGLSFVLATGAASAILASVLVATAGGRVLSGPLPGPLAGVVHWVLAVALLWLGILVILRYAPAEHRPVRWLSVGSVVIVAAWIVASLGFSWYVREVANFQSAFGTMTSFIVLSGYVYTSTIIFLVGAQIDQLLREEKRDPRLLEPLSA